MRPGRLQVQEVRAEECAGIESFTGDSDVGLISVHRSLGCTDILTRFEHGVKPACDLEPSAFFTASVSWRAASAFALAAIAWSLSASTRMPAASISTTRGRRSLSSVHTFSRPAFSISASNTPAKSWRWATSLAA